MVVIVAEEVARVVVVSAFEFVVYLDRSLVIDVQSYLMSADDDARMMEKIVIEVEQQWWANVEDDDDA